MMERRGTLRARVSAEYGETEVQNSLKFSTLRQDAHNSWAKARVGVVFEASFLATGGGQRRTVDDLWMYAAGHALWKHGSKNQLWAAYCADAQHWSAHRFCNLQSLLQAIRRGAEWQERQVWKLAVQVGEPDFGAAAWGPAEADEAGEDLGGECPMCSLGQIRSGAVVTAQVEEEEMRLRSRQRVCENLSLQLSDSEEDEESVDGRESFGGDSFDGDDDGTEDGDFLDAEDGDEGQLRDGADEGLMAMEEEWSDAGEGGPGDEWDPSGVWDVDSGGEEEDPSEAPEFARSKKAMGQLCDRLIRRGMRKAKVGLTAMYDAVCDVLCWSAAKSKSGYQAARMMLIYEPWKPFAFHSLKQGARVEVSERRCFRVIPSEGFETESGLLSLRKSERPGGSVQAALIQGWEEELGVFAQLNGLPEVEEVVLEGRRYAGRKHSSLLVIMVGEARVKFDNVQMGGTFVDFRSARNRRKAKQLGRGVSAPKLAVLGKVQQMVNTAMEGFIGWRLSYVTIPTYLCAGGVVVQKPAAVRLSGVPEGVTEAGIRQLCRVAGVPSPEQLVLDRLQQSKLPGTRRWILAWAETSPAADATSPAQRLQDFGKERKAACVLGGQPVSVRRLDTAHAGGRFTKFRDWLPNLLALEEKAGRLEGPPGTYDAEEVFWFDGATVVGHALVSGRARLLCPGLFKDGRSPLRPVFDSLGGETQVFVRTEMEIEGEEHAQYCDDVGEPRPTKLNLSRVLGDFTKFLTECTHEWWASSRDGQPQGLYQLNILPDHFVADLKSACHAMGQGNTCANCLGHYSDFESNPYAGALRTPAVNLALFSLVKLNLCKVLSWGSADPAFRGLLVSTNSRDAFKIRLDTARTVFESVATQQILLELVSNRRQAVPPSEDSLLSSPVPSLNILEQLKVFSFPLSQETLPRLRSAWASLGTEPSARLVNGQALDVNQEISLLAPCAVDQTKLGAWIGQPEARQRMLHEAEGMLARAAVALPVLKTLQEKLAECGSNFEMFSKLGEEESGLGYKSALVPVAKSRLQDKFLPYLKQLHHEVKAAPLPVMQANRVGGGLKVAPSYMHVLHSCGKSGLEVENRMELGQGVDQAGPLSEFKKELSKRQTALANTEPGAAFEEKQDYVTQAVNCGKVRLLYNHSGAMYEGVMGWRGSFFPRAMAWVMGLVYSNEPWSASRNTLLFLLPFVAWNLHRRNDAAAAAREQGERKPSVKGNHWHLFVKELALHYNLVRIALVNVLEEDGEFAFSLLKRAAKTRSNRDTDLVEVGRTAEFYNELSVLLWALRGRSPHADARRDNLFQPIVYHAVALFSCIYALDAAFKLNLLRCLVLMDRTGVSEGIVFVRLSLAARWKSEERTLRLGPLYKKLAPTDGWKEEVDFLAQKLRGEALDGRPACACTCACKCDKCRERCSCKCQCGCARDSPACICEGDPVFVARTGEGAGIGKVESFCWCRQIPVEPLEDDEAELPLRQ